MIDTRREGLAEERKIEMSQVAPLNRKGPKPANQVQQKQRYNLPKVSNHQVKDQQNISWEDQLSAVGDENGFSEADFESI
jgi:hypothetical protein